MNCKRNTDSGMQWKYFTIFYSFHWIEISKMRHSVVFGFCFDWTIGYIGVAKADLYSILEFK